ncbi:carboxylesterase family protein [Streptomyces sp. NPDC089919]|uniref:carboxylesterase/lipase family protein n=1 Tax=Streptomyces sp. NPDC089919 TaxID=3155188 RepID=UPI003432DBD9
MTISPKSLRGARGVAPLLLSTLLISAALTGVAAADHRPGGPTDLVATENGTVRGRSTTNGREFLGIPYAKAPRGDLRWEPPKPADDWRGVRDARHHGDACPQVKNPFSSPNYDRETRSEACLVLNVHTPPVGRGAGAPLPVMVFMHGGGNTGGSAPDVVPDEFARRTRSVVVTINYRLGALGFLHLPGTRGNSALLDQRKALTWVRDNITGFGGDRNRVTLAGQSAGGIAVCAHLASPGSRGLFHAAIMESGSIWDCQGATRAEADSQSRTFTTALGCTGPDSAVTACMRAMPLDRILAAQSGPSAPVWWRYAAGTADLPEQPAEAFASGHASRVPVMNGSTSREGLLGAYISYDAQGRELTAAEYPGALVAAFGAERGAQALARYPLTAYERPVYAYAAATGDEFFSCPTFRIDRALGRRGTVYAYEFADETSPFILPPAQPVDFRFGAAHSAELLYLYKAFGRPADLDARQRQLAAQMTEYWGAFLHGQVPQAAGQPDMPEYRNGRVLQLRTRPAGGNAVSTTLSDDHRCDLWNAPG